MITRSHLELEEPPINISDIYSPVEPYLDELDRFLQEQVTELEHEIQEDVQYVLSQSGKRLRAMLVAYSGWSGPSADRSNDLIKLGSIIELVHLATLVHDDVLDEANIRRRQETASKKFGPSAAVLIGDVLFSHALKLAADFDTNDVCRSVAQATARVCSGEIAQTYRRGKIDHSRDFYFRVIQLKTAELFEVACRLGSKKAGYSEAFSQAAGIFGRHLGIAYQIFDDLVDLCADELMIGKTLGTDLKKGKYTLPLLLLFEKLPKQELASLLTRLEANDSTVVNEIRARLNVLQVFDEVVSCFENELSKANVALAPFVDLPPVAEMQKIAQLIRSQLRSTLEHSI